MFFCEFRMRHLLCSFFSNPKQRFPSFPLSQKVSGTVWDATQGVSYYVHITLSKLSKKHFGISYLRDTVPSLFPPTLWLSREGEGTHTHFFFTNGGFFSFLNCPSAFPSPSRLNVPDLWTLLLLLLLLLSPFLCCRESDHFLSQGCQVFGKAEVASPKIIRAQYKPTFK